ncbi:MULTISPECIES: DUF3857 domain-containing protein [unclassified Leeuwenhoekiella]|uniref:DUF3857 domain-containing protein n=1 Tax=unclassified Leeuwenhoekiella TaxID=2615029 RepID=UPI000C3F1D27|nr:MULTISPECIES: DUF3857 domain-containing protein [unclassified Leeuwenhoekiella]MAW95055.1 hypothetical protein [Leeuwenhoekiella sp.]MBA79775.1 hypothetical protein [Leeuwenhoekiella sp.]|tara:strand:- start:1126 stop:3090 length:1965 start_codon:yes stop_codon:yes gene_type:complete
MRIILSLYILALYSLNLKAQENPVYLNYNWEQTPQFETRIPDSVGIVGLKDKMIVEFIFEDDNFVEYFLEHKAFLLNSDERIEEYNRIYLPYNNDSELQVNKARVIKPNGDVVELDESQILTAEDEETQRAYKFFAFEGIEKGSIIDYYYVVKKMAPDYSGKRINFQQPYQKKNIEFDLYAPENLVFQFKSYNGLPEVSQDTLSESKKHWQLNASVIPALEEEEQAPYEALRAFLIYKLDENLANNTQNIISYSKVSQNLYKAYYNEIDKKTQKKLDAFIAESGIKPAMSADEKLRIIESYIKTNVYLGEGGNSGNDLESVLDQKVANSAGMVRLFVGIFKTLDLNHELILTSDRQSLRFDPEFEANSFLNEFLFYFPETGKYLAPTESSSRYGFPPAVWTDNFGLVVKEVSLGNFKSAVGKIEYIKPVPAEMTVDRMALKVTFDEEDLTQVNVTLDRSFEGYYAMYMQPFMNLIPDDKKDELLQDFAKNLDENVVITEKNLNNADPALFGVEPLEFHVKFESEAFVEKAGNRYLFKIGELIGEQIQMYQENERKLPLEDEFTRTYYRDLEVVIPDGYTIANPEDINIDHSFVLDGEELLMFKSTYTLEGNVLKIKADEFYKVNKIDKDFFESYRSVVNSAADFNKVTLVLEPK